MSTYHNCYTMLGNTRRGLNEYSLARHLGTDTTGAYDNDWIIDRINRAQRHLYSQLFKYIPEHFLTSASLVGVDSVFTLPWDYGAIVEFQDDQLRKVYPATVRALPTSGGTGSDRVYYRDGNTLVLTKSGVTDTYTLWYYSKPRDLTQGKAAAGAATSITLATAAIPIVDYYNGISLEDITQSWVDVIDDYAANRVATISETAATDDYYGTISEIPEMFHPLIVPRATQICKAEHPLAQEKPTTAEVVMWKEEVVDALRAFAGSGLDVSQEEIWTDYNTGGLGGGGVDIPGQGYLIRG